MTLILFDLDDTLIDNTLYDIDSFEYVAKQFKFRKFSNDSIIQWRKHGMLAKNILKKLIRTNNKLLLQDCVKQRITYLDSGGSGTKLIKLKPDVYETLQILKKKKYNMAIVSARKHKPSIQNILKKFNVDDCFKKIYCASDYKDYSHKITNITLKEELYKMALLDFNKNPKHEKVFLIANLKSDFIPAKKLSIKGIGIRGSYRFDSGLSKMVVTVNFMSEIFRHL